MPFACSFQSEEVKSDAPCLYTVRRFFSAAREIYIITESDRNIKKETITNHVFHEIMVVSTQNILEFSS